MRRASLVFRRNFTALSTATVATACRRPVATIGFTRQFQTSRLSNTVPIGHDTDDDAEDDDSQQGRSTSPATPSSPSPAVLSRLDQQLRDLPKVPEPPPQDLCCMSGCARCVWDLYNDEITEYEEKVNRLKESYMREGAPVPDVLIKPIPVADMDPTMRAFRDMEKSMASNNKSS